MLKRKYVIILFFLATTASYANSWYFSSSIGIGLGNKHSQQSYSPVSGIINTYIPNHDHGNMLNLYTLGFGYQFRINNYLLLNVGLEPGYINYGKQKGIEKVATNLMPNLDPLAYSFTMSSYFILATSKLSLINYQWFPYVSVGIGKSYNTLSHYNEEPLGSTAPSEYPFAGYTKSDLAYAIQIGLFQSHRYKHFNFSIGYTLMSMGKGSLKNSTSGADALTSGRLYGNFLLFTINFS